MRRIRARTSERERHVGVQRPVGVPRPVEEGRRAGGPNRYKNVAGPPEHRQRAPVASRVSPHPPVIPSNGRAPDVGRRGPAAIDDREGRPLQIPSPPSRAPHCPPRRLLVLLLQQQLDALSDERRGVPVLRVGDQLPHEVPRRLIHAEGDDSRLSYHSLSSLA
jgi:hypothetical protein